MSSGNPLTQTFLLGVLHLKEPEPVVTNGLPDTRPAFVKSAAAVEESPTVSFDIDAGLGVHEPTLLPGPFHQITRDRDGATLPPSIATLLPFPGEPDPWKL